MRQHRTYGESVRTRAEAVPHRGGPMLTVLRTISRRVVAVIAECNYAQRRLAQLRASPDRYLSRPDLAPDTYQEFLFRTSGPLAHQPSTATRSSVRAIRCAVSRT